MLARFILSALFGASLLVGVNRLSVAGQDTIARTTAQRCAQNRQAVGTEPERASKFANEQRLHAQIIYASSCATFAGPVCPLRVLLPVGAPCACYYPNATLPGVAQ